MWLWAILLSIPLEMSIPVEWSSYRFPTPQCQFSYQLGPLLTRWWRLQSVTMEPHINSLPHILAQHWAISLMPSTLYPLLWLNCLQVFAIGSFMLSILTGLRYHPLWEFQASPSTAADTVWPCAIMIQPTVWPGSWRHSARSIIIVTTKDMTFYKYYYYVLVNTLQFLYNSWLNIIIVMHTLYISYRLKRKSRKQ